VPDFPSLPLARSAVSGLAGRGAVFHLKGGEYMQEVVKNCQGNGESLDDVECVLQTSSTAAGVAGPVSECASVCRHGNAGHTATELIVPVGRQREEISCLIRLHNDIEQLRDDLEALSGISRRRRRRFRPLVTYTTKILERLVRRLGALGVTPMPLPDRIDYRLHESYRSVITRRPEENGLVIEVYRTGFMRGDHVEQLAAVATLKYPSKPTT
jgi:hypothetical protein